MFLNECCISEVPINHIICLLFYNFKKYFKIKTTKFTTRWLETKRKKECSCRAGKPFTKC